MKIAVSSQRSAISSGHVTPASPSAPPTVFADCLHERAGSPSVSCFVVNDDLWTVPELAGQVESVGLHLAYTKLRGGRA